MNGKYVKLPRKTLTENAVKTVKNHSYALKLNKKTLTKKKKKLKNPNVTLNQWFSNFYCHCPLLGVGNFPPSLLHLIAWTLPIMHLLVFASFDFAERSSLSLQIGIKKTNILVLLAHHLSCFCSPLVSLPLLFERQGYTATLRSKTRGLTT